MAHPPPTARNGPDGIQHGVQGISGLADQVIRFPMQKE
jgi:hypothetical protein